MTTAFLAPYIGYIVAALTALVGLFLARKSGKDAVKNDNLKTEIEARNEAEAIRDDVRRDPAPASDWLRKNFNRDKR